MADTKSVRATEMGFYKGRMIPAGTIFPVSADFKAKWVVDASTPKAPEEVKTTRAEPTTLSEMARNGARGRKPIGVQTIEPLEKK